MSLLVCLLVTAAGLPGITTPMPTTVCTGIELANQTRAEWLSFHSPPNQLAPAADEPYWEPVDSFMVTGEFAPGRSIALNYQRWGYTLNVTSDFDTLPGECLSALDYAPSWLRPELSSAFRRLGDSAAVAYAELLLGTPAPYTDEVAFCIAAIGPEVLKHWTFNPDLLLANARQLYEIDDSLQFADIVDHGSQPGDYYSTVRYAVASGSETTWVELPRDIYYYYVVHPTTSDEIPRMDNYVYNMHWREYFFYHADSGFPVLQDYAKQAKVVWHRTREVFPVGRPFEPDDCALDVIGNWVTRTNIAGASGNRPIHPNVIAHEHNGNCGEIQDLWTAACRTCLLPVVNASDPCEDHVWNEFWDGGWYPLASDPSTHIADSGVAYEEAHGGSKQVSAVFNWRPDGYWWTSTGRYSNTCSLYVRVLDATGLPIDGARVLLYSEYLYGGLSVCTVSYTDEEGAAAFELGDLRNFYAQVTCPLGSWPSETGSTQIVNISQTGARYFSTLHMPWSIGAPRPRVVPFTGDSTVWYKYGVHLNLASGMNYGYSVARGAGTGDPDDSVRFYHYYADKKAGGVTDCFFSDSVGYAGYLGHRQFDALRVQDNASTRNFDIVCPTLDPYYLVLSSEDRLCYSSWLDAKVKLYIIGVGVADENPGSVAAASPPPTIVRGVLNLQSAIALLDASGREVLRLKAGPNDISGLSPGVYFVRSGPSAVSRQPSAPLRVVIVGR
jgi:hypothetical protein